MKNKMIIATLLTIPLLFSGCVSRLFSVGDEQTYCKEHGCDYTDVGVCAKPREVLENKHDLSEIKQRNEEARNDKWY